MTVFDLAQRYERASLEYARALGMNARDQGVSKKQCGQLRRVKTMAYDAWQRALFAQTVLKHNKGPMA